MASEEDDDYFVPLVDQRGFGAGLKRKRVAFISASQEGTLQTERKTVNTRTGDAYLSLVLKQKTDIDNSSYDSHDAIADVANIDSSSSSCPVCGQQLSLNLDERYNHDSSIAHQVCLAHSHPPSHVDRSRRGLKYLQGYGWDPDARKGLGARQEGILDPVKSKQKNNTTGIGMEATSEDDSTGSKRRRKEQPVQEYTRKLNAKAVKKMEIEKSKRAERLRQSFYGEDLSAYLSPNG